MTRNWHLRKCKLVSRKRGIPIYFIAPEWVLDWMIDEWDKRERKMGL